MVETTIKKQFWGCWNRPPIPEQHPEITKCWLKKADEQLSNSHLLKKTLSRLLFLYLTRQNKYWLDYIPKNTKKILWLHISDNLGDSLMRLAPIQLLKKFQIDLYASNAATQLFTAGKEFHQVYRLNQDASAVAANQYDLVIIDAVQTKPLKNKIGVAKRTPFVTLHELFHFCRDDYNPIYYTWWRMQYLLRQHNYPDLAPHLIMDIPESAKQKINASQLPANSIAVAVGGREAYRTYQGWDAVITALKKQNPEQTIVLLGSDNGKTIAQKIAQQKNVINCVAQYSLAETAAIIQHCGILFCADGGLLHVANAVNAKTISLFAQEFPELRYVEEDDYQALMVERDVNEINPNEIVKLCFDAK